MKDVWAEAACEGGTSKAELETTLETEVALASRSVLATRAALTTGAVMVAEAVLAAGTPASGTSVASRESIFWTATDSKGARVAPVPGRLDGTVKVELLNVGVRSSGGRLCERGELVTERARFRLLWVLT